MSSNNLHRRVSMKHRLTLLLEKQAEGGFTITCEELPELITECDTLDEAIVNALDAFCSVAELYEQENRVLPTLVNSELMSTHSHLPPVDVSHLVTKDNFNTPYALSAPKEVELNYLAMAVSLNELPNSGKKTNNAWL